MVVRLPDPAEHGLVGDLVAYAGRVAPARVGPPAVLGHRQGELVVRCGALVVKAHSTRTDTHALERRLALATETALTEVLLRPVHSGHLRTRFVTVWPVARALRPDAQELPWEEAGRLLARLHTARVPQSRVPEAGGPRKLASAMRRLAVHPAGGGVRAAIVKAAYASLPAWCRGSAPQPRSMITHGDFHFGQLVETRHGWRLIDLDDLGVGDPVWDLARPAAWFAAGVLPEGGWERFLTTYREHGGPAVGEDEWVDLDGPARALTVQTAALAIVNGDLDVAEVFVGGCRRIVEQERRLQATVT
ncbi:aminoglycoside phosphotransferase [Virgisporangium aliadipatigenens]|uniref:Aminoglycoside phosphotransferase n=1 Tax=Virgisporangium aliadipatigenens TaxID=741659 RepID=A0A8J4DQW5_9ACTN|nr:phosphotransferase [Virgisporangium aliadipatigenens]GIJ47019.1 aminoglycoside phosphotransferase [Virgisporangium aliadipatigenens]